MNLTTEQQSSVQSRTDSYNAANGTSLTAQDYLDRCCIAQMDAWVKADFDAAVSRLSAAAAKLAFEQRLALIAQVENQISQQG
jgi:hypothetical protein